MHSRKSGYRLNFLITAGGTREYIDPVRFISNASSGRMGYELAWAAALAGHNVTLITATTLRLRSRQANLPTPKQVAVIRIETAGEMFKAVKKHLPGCDCLVMAGAVSDYTPLRPARMKLKKTNEVITLKLKPTPDILKWAGRHKRRNQIIVGFALEDRNLRANAQRKLREKNLDMIVANRPEVIGKAEAAVEIKIAQGRWLSVRRTSKRAIARKIVRLIEKI